MILESLVFATQRTAPGARSAGIAAEQAAIAARYLRCREAWRPHLERCRAFILAGASQVARRRRVFVLGSGCLLDIPLFGLSRLFEQVVLVDAAQPLHARIAAWRHGNVEARTLSFVTTGLDVPRYRSWREALPEPDYIVASMLLSQLPPPRAGSADLHWRRALMAEALEDISAGREATCLITETSCILRRRGTEPEAQDPLLGVVSPPPLERWRWLLAPPGERKDGMIVELDVSASLRSSAGTGWLRQSPREAKSQKVPSHDDAG